MVLMGYSGVRGKLIYEKNLKLKISCQTPFKDIRLTRFLHHCRHNAIDNSENGTPSCRKGTIGHCHGAVVFGTTGDEPS